MKAKRCGVQGCQRAAVVRLETHAFCREHFISTCNGRLEECARLLDQRPLQDSAPESVRMFLHECMSQIEVLSQEVENLDSSERASLLDFLLRASEMANRLRRSSRS
jgi:hypothetical protein